MADTDVDLLDEDFSAPTEETAEDREARIQAEEEERYSDLATLEQRGAWHSPGNSPVKLAPKTVHKSR